MKKMKYNLNLNLCYIARQNFEYKIRKDDQKYSMSAVSMSR